MEFKDSDKDGGLMKNNSLFKSFKLLDILNVLKKINTRLKKKILRRNQENFIVLTSDLPIYDNRTGKLLKVGSLVKGLNYSRIGDYGNWHKVQFNDFFGYVKKSGTQISDYNMKREFIQEYDKVNFFLTKSVVRVYDSHRLNANIIGRILENISYQIVSDEEEAWGILFLNKMSYVYKKDVIPHCKEDIIRIVQMYTDKDKSEALSRIKPFLIMYSEDYKKSADNILKNLINIKGHKVIDCSSGIPWRENENYSRSFYRLLHGHYFINDLVNAFRENGNAEYIYKGFKIIEDWVHKNSYNNAQKTMAWHDETTSKRVKTWLNFFDVAKDVLNKKELLFFLENLLEHADLLASEEFHSKNTNHGMFQDEALLILSDYFDEIKNYEFYYSIATKRLKDYFNFIISIEGVHLEHSPIYHIIIARMIKTLLNYFNHISDIDTSRYYKELYEKMMKYTTYVIKPDGTLPGIGDSFNGLKGIGDLWRDNEQYLYSLTSGKKGVAPKETSMFFKEGGYAIIRDDWTKGKAATYVHFTAAYHTAYHKHSDDLSVWLYANGQDIISEAGPNGYDYNNEFTKYGYSSFAHNTLIVNNNGLPRVDKKFESTYLIDFEYNEGFTKVSGVNKRYKDTIHQRELLFDKKTKLLKVLDKITTSSKANNNYKVLWHLAEGVTPKIEGDNIYLLNDDMILVVMKIISSHRVGISSVFGQKDPYLLGWHIKGVNKAIKTHTLIIDINSDKDKEVVVESIYEIK